MSMKLYVKRLVFICFCFGLAFNCFAQSVDSVVVVPKTFCDSARVEFTVNTSDTISLRLYNLFGQVIHVFFDHELLALGKYSILYHPDSLPEGVYPIHLTGTGGLSKVFVLIKLKCAPLGIKPVMQRGLLFPNPGTADLFIDLSGTKTITLTNVYGQEVKKVTTALQHIDVSDLATGFYVVSVADESGKLVSVERWLKVP